MGRPPVPLTPEVIERRRLQRAASKRRHNQAKGHARGNARRRERMAADPEYRERMRERERKRTIERRQNPEYVRRKNEQGRERMRLLRQDPEWIARHNAKRATLMQDPAYREKVALRLRENNFKRKYGLTLAAWHDMFAAQNGQCALCAEILDASNIASIHVDHAHDTGKVRGLLCNFCNTGLGMFRDSPDLMQKAAEYILTHR